MSSAQRLGFLALAAAIAVAAFVLIGGEDGDLASEAPPAATSTPGAEVGAATPEPTPTATPTPRPEPPLLTAGSGRTVRVEQGERVRFRVRHPTAEEVHVHGYDISRPLEAGRTTTIAFAADITGIFEVELELSHQPLGTIEVRP